ncbi:MAG: glutamine synthetase III [Verrucomicrobia bacterium]|nr:glutamine synthetase III [Verrucomicrobiota bacterium]
MNARLESIRSIGKKSPAHLKSGHNKQLNEFGSHVFDRSSMELLLPKKALENLMNAIEGRERLDPSQVDAIAEVLKDWAIQHGATHYTHWFQPLTHSAAEKHDSFLSWNSEGQPIERFRGKELIQGEPDASSFPSGGLRCTHEARGYTVWDPTTPPFLWTGGDGVTLCIPSVFFSWKGEALDHKLPLLRSEQKIQEAGLRLLKFCGVEARAVYSTLGAEQEYFAIDRSLYLLRPDLSLVGRTVFGARPPKGQELEDHYFSSVKDRVLAYMHDFEREAAKLGIPLKTRHNEVAPAQHEVAPLFEKASLAVDHNLLLMELMRQTAVKHDLACLFHEKPFAGINGSGKHCNWSLATDTGLNLLDPKENSLLFLALLTAVIRAVHHHATLLRATIASPGNDHRLGGSEAPPTILSVYLGESLEKLVSDFIHERIEPEKLPRQIDLGLSHLPRHTTDRSDRNRTSFFAFTGNKFEFRAVGASASCSFPIAALNAIVADSLHQILDEMEKAAASAKGADQKFKLCLPILRMTLLASQPVIFGGNGYSAEWEKEAEKRGLPNIRKSYHAYAAMLDKSTIRALTGVLSEHELHSRYEIQVEQYAKTVQIEANLMIELFRTQILPAAVTWQEKLGRSLAVLSELKINPETRLLDQLSSLVSLIGDSIAAIDEVERVAKQTADLGWEAKAKVFCELASPKMEEARRLIDRLEAVVDNAVWPLPKYRELLFII